MHILIIGLGIEIVMEKGKRSGLDNGIGIGASIAISPEITIVIDIATATVINIHRGIKHYRKSSGDGMDICRSRDETYIGTRKQET